ncbi:MAG TPA: formylglycine-generating enzyme family protein [bacterium]
MKTYKGIGGMNYGIFFSLLIFLIFPEILFPQLTIRAAEQHESQTIVSVPKLDSTVTITSPIDTTIQDSLKLLQSLASPDTTVDLLPQIKFDYSTLEVKIEINADEQYTKSREVSLSLISPYAKEMLIGNEPDLTDGKWESFQSPKSWIVKNQDGFQSVYFQVRYPDSTISSRVFDQIILNSRPPVPRFEVKPDSGIAGETVFFFDASNSSHNFDLLLRWDWEGDGIFDTDWSFGKQEMHQYRLGGGKKQIRLEVKDSGGWLVSVTEDIHVFSRPHPDFRYSQDFIEPLKIMFDASPSGDYEDGNELLYRWDFAADSLWDTDWSPNKLITKSFALFDEKIVLLEAKDKDGFTNTFQQTIINNYKHMIYIPAGSFFMGHGDFELDERPVHEIYLDDYWINKYQVTNREFARFLNEYIEKYPEKDIEIATFINLSSEDSRIYYEASSYVASYEYENHPVVNVTWHGADAYCRFYEKHLPTEAEWEKAARGTDQRLYSWGNSVDSSRANYWDSGDPFDNGTTPVGFYNGQNYSEFQTNDSPSFFGGYDMGGNVREWVSDWYLWNFYAQSPTTNPAGPKSGTKKVVRGGSYLFHSDDLRVTARYSTSPEHSISFIGFRCVKSKKE